ncbi:uncharacterized protein CANTADRAFT_26754 [Suhomyces tanzawaensis NRRL Y-17324]|uniref:Uncharacterized protein n=1 Tax=Suhomyces tanzawaensis NRRL Y-17324 TaxID=984487 RepID=A0A1E4SH71_9ASCO|nr:uncharacterized protein CANTADRAFT_26754 [Suhomyces tanzawaensis NRRL Y-17324]ODV78825.1 hypothetical protein CANTADRAFT_26754 [Suhomyces tanzawaensis NRRL Y-17324]
MGVLETPGVPPSPIVLPRSLPHCGLCTPAADCTTALPSLIRTTAATPGFLARTYGKLQLDQKRNLPSSNRPHYI